mgnify:CR=1 FL=1|nr:MAG TPA: hypothetical protein [Bacteriophage sp.]
MNKIYSRIIWKNYPNTSTALSETNLNRMDKAIDDLDNRVIEQDSTKADQTTVNNMVKNWTMDETTGVITVEKQDGSKIMFDLNIEKIPVTFELSPSGILTMTTSDGTQFTANIGSMIPVLTFNESDQIAVSVSGSGVNKTYSFTVKDGSITENKLQPNYLADIKSESAKAKMSETNAEKFKNESEKIYEAMKRLEHKIEVNENEPSDLNVNDEWLNFYGTSSDFNKAKNYVKTTEGYKLLSRWTSSDTVDVNGKTLTGVVDELKKTSQDNGYGEVAGGKNLLNPTLVTTTQNGVTCTNNGDGTYTLNGTASVTTAFDLGSVKTINGIDYKITGCPKNGSVESYYSRLQAALNVADIGDGALYKSNGTEVHYFILVDNGKTVNNLVFKPMITTNLDANYDDYEPYFPSNKMLAEENTQQSTEIMDIKMLGWSVPRECPIQNEVNGNQFIQKVGRADMSKLAWYTYSSTGIFRFASGSGAKYTKYNIKRGSFAYSRGYKYVGTSGSWADISNYGNKDIMGVWAGGGDDGFILTNNSYTNSSDFKQAMQGQYLYYELATPITTTIDGNEIGETVSDVRKETTVNLLNPTLGTTTQNGITCTNNGDGTYTLNGTATANFSEYITTLFGLSQNESYKLLGTPVGGSAQTYSITLLSEDFSDYVDDIGEGVIITPKKSSYLARLNIFKGTTVNNLVFKPILTTNLNATMDDFVGYTGSTGSLNGDVADIRKDIKTLENYKTTETVIGKWDDYTLCRKVISGKHAITAGNEFSFLVDTITSDEGVVMEIKNIRGRAQGSIISGSNKDVDSVMAVGSYCNANYYCGCFMPGSSPESISLLGKFGNSVNYVEVELCVEYTVERI